MATSKWPPVPGLDSLSPGALLKPPGDRSQISAWVIDGRHQLVQGQRVPGIDMNRPGFPRDSVVFEGAASHAAL